MDDVTPNGNGDAHRALSEIRELRREVGDLGVHLVRIEGMVSGQAQGFTEVIRRVTELERHREEAMREIAALKVAAALGAPLQKLAWVIISAIVLGFGSLVWVSSSKPAAPPNVTIQMPASATP